MRAPKPASVADAHLDALAALNAMRLREHREVLKIGMAGPWTFAAMAALAEVFADEVDRLGGDSQALMDSIYERNTPVIV